MKDSNYYSLLDWDSKFFGYPVAKLTEVVGQNLKSILEELKSRKIKLVYWFTDSDNPTNKKILVTYNGILVDEKRTYVIDITKVKKIGIHHALITSYPSKRADNDLVSLALQAGEFSRFFVDKHFTHNEYQKLYTTWIQLSVQRKIAFEVLQYIDINNKIAGVITLASKNNMGQIGLLAVDRAYRNKLIGKALVIEALHIFKRKGCATVCVTTQGKNIIACKFYETLGFTLHKKEYVYHFWL
jgi:dTDP-4-amino-4,6-dideoxy-D-galactose acyltransferase